MSDRKEKIKKKKQKRNIGVSERWRWISKLRPKGEKFTRHQRGQTGGGRTGSRSDPTETEKKRRMKRGKIKISCRDLVQLYNIWNPAIRRVVTGPVAVQPRPSASVPVPSHSARGATSGRKVP